MLSPHKIEFQPGIRSIAACPQYGQVMMDMKTMLLPGHNG
jgi:hypothetical protein